MCPVVGSSDSIDELPAKVTRFEFNQASQRLGQYFVPGHSTNTSSLPSPTSFGIFTSHSISNALEGTGPDFIVSHSFWGSR